MEGLQTILEFFHLYEAHMLALVAGIPRMLAFFATALIFSQAAMTRVARNGLVIALSLPVAPANYRVLASGPIDPGYYLLMLGKEFLLGLALGYCFGWIFWAIQSAGALVDNQCGASIAESLDPLQGHQASPLGNLFSQAMTTYMFLTGGVLLMLGALYQSYVIWPVISFTPRFSASLMRFTLEMLDIGMRAAFVYAAPLILIMFIAEAALALISRFAPQIQVFILAMPIKSGIALFILIMYVVVLFPEAGRRTRDALILSDRIFTLTGSGQTGTPP